MTEKPADCPTRVFFSGLATWLCFAAPALAEEPVVPAVPAPPAISAEQEPVLQVTDLVPGVGDAALPGMIVVVHYTGWLYDPVARNQRGKQFDSSRERKQPLSFPLGRGHVIQGWEQGVPGLRVGGLRRLVIPPSLAYGARNVGNGLIPPNSTLLFEIELLAVESVTFAPQTE